MKGSKKHRKGYYMGLFIYLTLVAIISLIPSSFVGVISNFVPPVLIGALIGFVFMALAIIIEKDLWEGMMRGLGTVITGTVILFLLLSPFDVSKISILGFVSIFALWILSWQTMETWLDHFYWKFEED